MSFYEAASQQLINNGGKVFAVAVGDFRCMVLDTAEDLQLAKDEVVEFLS